MKVVSALEDVTPPDGGAVVTIGAYDGVHLGHRAVLAEVARLARGEARAAVLLTFDRHPASVVRPGSAPRLLTDLDQRLELLAATGDLDVTVVLPFDERRSREEPEHFVRTVLVEALGARVVAVGEDFHFGHGRRGDVTLLRDVGGELDLRVAGLSLSALPGAPEPVSSTSIRAALARGDVAAASAALGRLHEVRGLVVTGDGRGATLGFPTANVAVPPEIQLPGVGIYAGWYDRPGGQTHAAAISVGGRPTFYAPGAPTVLEVHLLDFDGDLYGEAARVRFAARLRGEVRFESTAALVEAIAGDVVATRALLCGAA